MLSPTAVRAEVADGIARLTLDRPDHGNAIDLTVARELSEITMAWAVDPSVRVVVLAGAGARFCVGGDLQAFAAIGDDLPRLLTEITTHLHAALARLARMDAPVIAAVQGSAAGAGLGLAAVADIVLAAASARFVMAYTGIGLAPDGASTWTLPRTLGLRAALDLALTNRPMDAPEALAQGLVSRVVPDAELEDATDELAAQLASGPTAALGATKRLLRGSIGRDLEAQMEMESAALAAAAASADGREGIEAFLAKRPPRFTGRDDG
jgi:2-(1,2-epoxy-1,2-dihydrophenyl)acetyl-CoA isomerase